MLTHSTGATTSSTDEAQSAEGNRSLLLSLENWRISSVNRVSDEDLRRLLTVQFSITSIKES
jgi:hypothetical protein